MSRRDLIIIAVLLNSGLLAILFMMAINTDEEDVGVGSEIVQTVIKEPEREVLNESEPISIAQSHTSASDEWDNVIKDYAATVSPQTIVQEEESADELEAVAPAKPMEEAKSIAKADDQYVEVTVKRGDALEKIARANGTTTETIKKINNLKNDRLSIGQVLRVPKGGKAPVAKTEPTKSVEKQIAQADPEYYTIKSGDNPWKIAKQFRVKFDDLLKLNNLDEEKARNLKIGDRIRVK